MSSYNSKQLTISELINTGIVFEIPDYQRGYRWGKTEVIDLLEDIMDVVEDDVTTDALRRKCKEEPYCLQPISFDTSKENEGLMIVVDGQQRLTTIYLILKYISKRFGSLSEDVISEMEIDDPEEFCKEIVLKYKDPTRAEVFEKVKLDLSTLNVDNIDAYYITEAYRYISEWGKERIKKAKALNQFAIKFLYGTSVIWYEIDMSTDGTPNEFFSKTNTGRIPLTSSELIKANLMLDEYCVKKESVANVFDSNDLDKGKKEDELRRLNMERLENQRIKISRQWDNIENMLRNDEFWYFLTENSDQYEDTRIDFIFNIVAKELFSELDFGYDSWKDFYEMNKERGAFVVIARYLKDNEERDQSNSQADPIGVYVWKKAWNTFMTFREWFDNREWYHFIGYILSADDSCSAESILEIFNNSSFVSKKEIRDSIVRLIEKCGHLSYEDSDGCTKKRTLENYKQYLKTLDYDKNRIEINRILLLFNVISVLNDKSELAKSSRDTYFPFSRYKKEKWNLEHIHSKADGEFTKEFAGEYMNYIEEMWKRLENDESTTSQEYDTLNIIRNKYSDKLKKYIQDGISEDESSRRAAQESSEEWIQKYRDDLDDGVINGIGNMTLLDETTNKSYHNAPFFMKRMIIGDIVMGKKKNISRFIPFCTRNVFDKTYTKLPSDMMHWNQFDYDDYLDTIGNVIYSYFEGGNN